MPIKRCLLYACPILAASTVVVVVLIQLYFTGLIEQCSYWLCGIHFTGWVNSNSITAAVAIANRGAVDGAGGDGVARGSSVVSPLNGIQEHGQGLQKKKTEVTAAAMTSLSSSCSSSSACNDVTLTSNDAAWFVESWIVEYAIAYQHMSVVNSEYTVHLLTYSTFIVWKLKCIQTCL